MSDGSISDPFHGLTAALSNPLLNAGQTIYLRAGTYSGDVVLGVSGTPSSPIVIRAYPNERVIINGSLSINSPYTHWYGIEFTRLTNSGRQSAQNGSVPGDIPTAEGINIHAAGTKIINCIIHDFVGDGIGLWSDSPGSELYGNLIYYNGWDAPDRGHGHGIYTQNRLAPHTIKDNILFDGFQTHIKVYTEEGFIDNYLIEGNTAFRAVELDQLNGAGNGYDNIFVGSINPAIVAHNITVKANMTYHTKSEISNYMGYTGGIADDVIQDNRFIGPIALAMRNITNTLMNGNTIIGSTQVFDHADYPDNIYGNYPSIGNVAIVRPNTYQLGRANITIYNEAQANSVSVNVSSVLANGAAYRLRNVQDYFTDWQTGNVAGDGTISVNMQVLNRTVATPVNWTAPSSTFPLFGAFVLEAA